MTDKTPAEMLDALGKPFPRTAIKQRKGGGGKSLSYVETHTVIHRLNTATNGWDFFIRGYDWRGDLLMVHGELTIHGLGTRSGFGVQQVVERAGEDLVKGAASDCLKKCATLFGVALDLYGADYENMATGAPQEAPGASNAPHATASKGSTVASAHGVVVAQSRHIDAPPPKDMRGEALGRTLHGIADHDFLHALATKWGFASFAAMPADNRQRALDYLNGRGDAAKLAAFNAFVTSWEQANQRSARKALEQGGLLPTVEEVPNPDRFTR
jgi:hypothetical protein